MIGYMIIPLGLTDEQEHIYIKLYKKCDFNSMTVKYTLDQLVLDSNKCLNLTRKKIYTIIKYLIEEGFIKEIKKGTKGKPTIYEIVKINEISRNELGTNRERIGNELGTNNADKKPLLELSRNKWGTNGERIGNELGTPIKEKEKEKEKEYICAFVNNIWSMYPQKKGKAQAIKSIPKIVKAHGEEQIKRCVERYKQEIEKNKTEKQYIKHGSTFFNSGYVDYLDCNYEEKPKVIEKPKLVRLER